jgi:hypothetical protein
MRKIQLLSLFFVFLAVSPVVVLAFPVTYIYNGVGSGALDTAEFINTTFTITAVADTDNISSWCCSDLQNTHISTTIDISGLGLFSITTPSQTWYSNLGNSGVIGLGADLGYNWLTLYDTAFMNYGLDTDLGPILAANIYDVNQFSDVVTSGGILSFSAIDSASFQAITDTAPVPEPTSLLLLGTGLGVIGLAAWRRRK